MHAMMECWLKEDGCDPALLRPDEFKLVVKGAGRDVTQQYAVA